MLRGEHDLCTHVYTAALASEAPTVPEEERSPRWREQPGGPGAPAATARAGFQKPRAPRWGRTLDSGHPDGCQVPQRLPDTQVSRPAQGATGSSRARLWPQPTRPALSLPGCAPAKPGHGRPRPAPGSAPGSTGGSPPGAGHSSTNSDEGSWRLGSRRRGHCRAAGPLWGPQGPASHPPAGRPLGGQDSRPP